MEILLEEVDSSSFSLSQLAWDTTYANFTKCCTSAPTLAIMGLLIILFPFLPDLAQFSPGSAYGDGHLNLLARRFAHQG